MSSASSMPFKRILFAVDFPAGPLVTFLFGVELARLRSCPVEI